jgi:hypothetical protein
VTIANPLLYGHHHDPHAVHLSLSRGRHELLAE